MSKWEKVRLGDVCIILDSQRIPITSSERVPGPYPYYGANGIQDYVNDYIFDDELVLLAEDGGNFGDINKPIAYRVSGKCWVNNHAHVLKPKENLNVDYLCYSIMFYDVSKLINGTTREKLNQASVRKMEIPLPPLAEQKRIADVLDTASGLIKKRKEQIRLIDQLAKSLFIEMFGDPVENPMGWETLDLKNITLKIGSGATPRGGKGSYISEGICLIRSMNVHNGRFKYNDLAHITKEQAKQLDVVTLKENDVLINITGASVARSCIVPRDILPARVNQHVSILRCNPTNVKPEYLSQLLINENYQISLLDISRGGGATREAITKLQLEHLPIPLPPLSLQQEFADRIDAIEKQKALFETGLEKLETNYRALMQEYFG